MSFPQRARLSAVLPRGSSVLHLARETEGTLASSQAGPHLPLPEPALKLGPHSSASVWDWASSPLCCFSASDLDLLLIPGSPPVARVPTPRLVTCSRVVWTGVRNAAPPPHTSQLTSEPPFLHLQKEVVVSRFWVRSQEGGLLFVASLPWVPWGVSLHDLLPAGGLGSWL